MDPSPNGGTHGGHHRGDTAHAARDGTAVAGRPPGFPARYGGISPRYTEGDTPGDQGDAEHSPRYADNFEFKQG